MSDKAAGTNASPRTVSQHEINYTPSRWSKRFVNEESLLEYFFEFCNKTTAEVRKSIKCNLNQPYGNTERSKYDIYGLDLPQDSPILIFIHGGYWQEFSKDLAGFAVPAFVQNGVKVVNVGYDLCPKVRIGDIVSEMKAVVEHILKSAVSTGCKRVWIVGHSAGAHLAASLLHDAPWIERMMKEGYFSLIRGFLLIGGIYELEPLLSTSFNIALQLTDDEVKTYSFSKLDTAHCSPISGLKVVVTVGEHDTPIFVNESREYARKIMSFVDNVEFMLIRNDVDHFDIVEKLVNPEYVLTKLLLNDMIITH